MDVVNNMRRLLNIFLDFSLEGKHTGHWAHFPQSGLGFLHGLTVNVNKLIY